MNVYWVHDGVVEALPSDKVRPIIEEGQLVGFLVDGAPEALVRDRVMRMERQVRDGKPGIYAEGVGFGAWSADEPGESPE